MSAIAATGITMPGDDRELDKDRWYSLSEVARLLHLSEKTVRERYLMTGELKSSRVSRRWLVYEKDLTAFLEMRRFDGGDDEAA